MTRKALYLFSTVFVIACGTIKTHSFRKCKPEVEPQLQKYFDKLDSIYSSAGIMIDYRKVSTIQVIDSLRVLPGHSRANYEGIYNRISKKVYINTFQAEAFWAGKYEDMIILVMAHEIGHSQGVRHTSDPCSIMYPSSTYSMELMSEFPIDYLVCDIYRTEYPPSE